MRRKWEQSTPLSTPACLLSTPTPSNQGKESELRSDTLKSQREHCTKDVTALGKIGPALPLTSEPGFEPTVRLKQKHCLRPARQTHQRTGLLPQADAPLPSRPHAPPPPAPRDPRSYQTPVYTCLHHKLLMQCSNEGGWTVGI